MRSAPRTLLAAAAALGMWACSPPPEGPPEGPPGAEAPSDPDAPERPDSRPSLPALLAYVHDRDPSGELPVLDGLPPAQRRLEEPIENRHDPSLTDTLVTLVYPGLEVEVYRVTATGREIVRTIEVTGEAYRTAEGIGPGSTRQELTRVLGEPGSAEGSTLTYRLAEGEHDPTPATLAVVVRNDRVQEMTWSYYVD